MRARLLLTVAAAALLAGAAQAQDRVGVTAAVNQSAEFERASGRKTVVIGENVLYEDRVVTSEDALVQILFVDGSAFTIGSNARVVIDEFVFNPSTGSGDLVAEVTEGALRFVGGKLSKSGGQVRLRTPVGTLGVRGAIVNVDLAPPCAAVPCPIATASLVFGREIVATTANGRTHRVYRPGYSLVFSGDPNNPTVSVVPTASLDQSSLQARLSGRAGRNGGATVIPTNADVVASGVPRINSDLSPRFVLPRPRPTIVATRYTPDEDDPGITVVTNEVNDTIVNQARGDAIDNEVAREEPEPPPPPPPPPPVTRTATGFLTTPDDFETTTGVEIPVPQEVNITTRDTRGIPVVVVENASGDIEAVEVGDLSFDWPDEEGETPIPPTFSVALGEEVEGTILRLPGEAALFFLQEIGTARRVGYVVVGEPTPREVFYPDTPNREPSYRRYELGTDYEKRAEGISSSLPLLNPLVAQSFGNAFLDAAVETDVYLVDRLDLDFIQLLYAGMNIEGQGAEQRSAVSVIAGGVYRATVGGVDDALGVAGERRGSYRLAAGQSSVGTGGAIGTVQVGNSELNTSVIGPNGEVFILSSAQDIGFARNAGQPLFRDVGLSTPSGAPGGPTDYSSMIVPAILAGTERLDTLERTGRALTGFAAGMVESGDGTTSAFRSPVVGNFEIEFSRRAGSLGGTILVGDMQETSSVAFFRYAFGYDTTGEFRESTLSRATYLDDDVYVAGATGRGNLPGSPTTLLVTDDEVVIEHSQSDPGTYLVSSDAVPQPQLFAGAGVTECTCDFLEWGWWGSQTDFEDPSLPDGGRRDFVHLGTWAAGDVTDEIDLPTTGSASYAGHAIGSVVNAGTQYVAAGNLSLNYDFGQRTGSMAITNFDGRNFGGQVIGVTGLQTGNQFVGALDGSGLSGGASGAFVRGPAGPAQGVLGSFDVSGEAYKASGTFVGQQ